MRIIDSNRGQNRGWVQPPNLRELQLLQCVCQTQDTTDDLKRTFGLPPLNSVMNRH